MRYPLMQNPPVFSYKAKKMLPGYPMMRHNPDRSHHYMNEPINAVANASVAMIGIGTIGILGMGAIGLMRT